LIPAPFPPAAALGALMKVLPDADLVLFADPRPSKPARVLVVAPTRASDARLLGVLRDAGAYGRAIPALIRSDLQPRKSQSQNTRTLLWEVEVPLWNLEGKLLVKTPPHGARLELFSGDLSPGLFSMRVLPAQAGTGTWLVVDATLNVREANWFTKRLAARSPLAEPAMLAATAYVLARGLALEAERTLSTAGPKQRSHGPRKPRAALPLGPAPLQTLDGTALGQAWAASAGLPLVASAVRRRPDGGMARIEVAMGLKASPDAIARGLRTPGLWRALPGWKKITALARPRGQWLWQVGASFPFVDLDANWLVTLGPPLRAEAISGDMRGAALGWDVIPGGSGGPAVAVFSLHPRLETTGYLPRKFIEAEPLLEHGMSLGLAYVDAMSLARAVSP
jgi:hypothetical protein